MLPSYPSIFNVGHGAIRALTNFQVYLEEKVDGSQFSFGLHRESGELQCRSKGAPLYIDAPNAMFEAGVKAVKEIAHLLTPGWVYRGEYLAKPKHNTLVYSRVPVRHVILFDIQTGPEEYLPGDLVRVEAGRLGLEAVPILYSGMITDAAQFRAFLDRESVLGGQKIEGVVIKQVTPQLYGADKKLLIGKFVSEAFKEIHGGEWRKNNPTSGDAVQTVIEAFKTPARWNKAVQHLRDAGQLTDSPKDIGALMKEVTADVLKECEGDIKDRLFAHFWKHIQRGIVAGLPEWYKQQLVEKQFEA